jgi:hypothetical protein
LKNLGGHDSWMMSDLFTLFTAIPSSIHTK